MKVSKKFIDWLSSWEGEEISKKDLIPFEKETRKLVPVEWRESRPHFETMVALIYSRGGKSLTANTPLALALKKHHSQPNERAVATGILLSRDGDIRRRKAEEHLFLHGNYRHKK
jgi:GH24 family phage-related lysozyme (muramidase)